MSVMEELVQLERTIDQLERRYDRFLAHEAGATVPTVAEIDAVEQRLRQLSLRDAVSPVERGRLRQLASRLAVKAASWRRIASQDARRPGVAPVPQRPTSSHPANPAAPQSEHTEAGVSPTVMEEYRRLFARYQATMERVGEPIPTNFVRFVQELEEQRRRLAARGLQVEGFDVVREASGVRVRPRTRAPGH
jgi:hypothetical protein